MKITVEPNEITYEATAACYLFFQKEEEGDLFVRAQIDGSSVKGSCTLTVLGKQYRGEFVFELEQEPPAFETKRFLAAAAARAIRKAAKEAHGQDIPLPWGLMLGVRPAKMLREYHERGFSYEQAAERLKLIYDLSREKAELLTNVARSEKAVLAQTDESLISFYVGIPFCPTRCLYCSFVSNDMRRVKKYIEPYCELLVREIRAMREVADVFGKKVQAIYIGGGTPTSLEADQLSRILAALTDGLDTSCLTEFTVEAGRADTVTKEKLRAMKQFPVDRVSINPQTFHDVTLERIGRCHSVADVYRAFGAVRETADFKINMDLIAGLPGESESMFCESIDRLLELAPENATVHTLCLKRGSRLSQGADDLDAHNVNAMLTYAQNRLMERAYLPYYLYRQKYMVDNLENVGYALAGTESIYNVNIMEESQTILAAGCGASSKIVNRNTGKIDRVFNYKDPIEYISGFDEILNRKRKIMDLVEANE